MSVYDRSHSRIASGRISIDNLPLDIKRYTTKDPLPLLSYQLSSDAVRRAISGGSSQQRHRSIVLRYLRFVEVTSEGLPS